MSIYFSYSKIFIKFNIMQLNKVLTYLFFRMYQLKLSQTRNRVTNFLGFVFFLLVFN